MTDTTELNPTRIEGLRDPARHDHVDPNRIWEILESPTNGAIVDVGAGVGYVTLPFARALPQATVIACDLLPGMLALLAEAAQAEALDNIFCRNMVSATQLPLDDGEADLVVMLQVHHHLDDPQGLLNDCKRVLVPGGKIVIVDWKDKKADGLPASGRRVAAATICEQLASAGFIDVEVHAIYTHHHCISASKRTSRVESSYPATLPKKCLKDWPLNNSVI